MFIPTTPAELQQLGWSTLDVILVNGDTYIDSPFSGIALIGQQLLQAGYRVGIIAQPETDSIGDISRLGQPRLFWGVSAGTVDSMVANRTALGKPRRSDDHTPGGVNNRRPDRATIVYSNLIRRAFKETAPIVLGGIEASLRRLTHYDYWNDSLRRPLLFDAKADYLLYGMADLSILELAALLAEGKDPHGMRGLCYLSSSLPEDALELPSWEQVTMDKHSFTRMFKVFYENNNPVTGRQLAQSVGSRWLVQNPPPEPLTTAEMDEVYSLAFAHAVHPFYAAQGEVRALETIRHAIPTHRGCYGECNFCAIAAHEGRRVSWRSRESILSEAQAMTHRPDFRGVITDLSGPTANMYGFECRIKATRGACRQKSCVYPQVCPQLGLNHQPHLELLQQLRQVPGVRKVFIASGIRYDMVMADRANCDAYLDELVREHVSGQLKLAPEHSQPDVLRHMRKPTTESLIEFKARFDQTSREAGKEQYLTYYFIAAYPGCSEQDMQALHTYTSQVLHARPEQVQIFTPTPSTWASVMYYTEEDPFTGEALFVEKNAGGKARQKAIVTDNSPSPHDAEFRLERGNMNPSDDEHRSDRHSSPRGDRARSSGRPSRNNNRTHSGTGGRPYSSSSHRSGAQGSGERAPNSRPNSNNPDRSYAHGSERTTDSRREGGTRSSGGSHAPGHGDRSYSHGGPRRSGPRQGGSSWSEREHSGSPAEGRPRYSDRGTDARSESPEQDQNQRRLEGGYSGQRRDYDSGHGDRSYSHGGPRRSGPRQGGSSWSEREHSGTPSEGRPRYSDRSTDARSGRPEQGQNQRRTEGGYSGQRRSYDHAAENPHKWADDRTGRAPKANDANPQEPQRRVVTDEFGGFFKNTKPEGWHEREPRRSRPESGPRRTEEAQRTQRSDRSDAYQGSGRSERSGFRSHSSSDNNQYGHRTDHPAGDRQQRSYPARSSEQRSEGNPHTHASADRPYNRRNDSHPTGERRPYSHKPYGQDRSGGQRSGKPYGPKDGNSGRSGKPNRNPSDRDSRSEGFQEGKEHD